MVMTHRGQAEKTKLLNDMFVKEPNPARIKMSHAEAVADSKRQRDEWEKVQEYKRKLAAERKAGKPLSEPPVTVAPEEQALTSEVTEEIERLKRKIEAQKGPGSKARKEELRAKIKELGG